MPVSVPDTLASPELACRCDAPRPQDSVQPGVAAQPDVAAESSADRVEHVAGTAQGGPGAASSNEIDGPGGPEPTRYGDWERRGRCIDF
ncbi:MAG TPA: DUF1674 domain-containing protein [Steroidobacteraceae bacterium]|nr:DUF1674 domain-containing protein [Steroidobacteraceae bacterium]